MNKVELLAPAANLRCGIAAIEAGADAVYIGGPSFGAREKAGNSMEDIGQLTRYAHVFGAKIYLTLNTILYDHELADVEKLIWEAWDVGVDAIIVQDMGILEMNLPPIELHASTQTFNLTAEKVKFLEDVGFSRVVLERGIMLREILSIRQLTNVEFEAFVHGAICVGYSGQCYLSQALCGRSGNRGVCAQPCRSQWNLIREDGTFLKRGQTLLSVGDLNLSDDLKELIEAGVCSLKIEGRLKDEEYVVNNVSYYNQKLNVLGVERTSCGYSKPSFVPNPEKSFSRSFSNYFLTDRTPKRSLLNNSKGEYLGKVIRVERDYFELGRSVKVNNGDGISFVENKTGLLTGTNVNTAIGGKISPNKIEGIAIGTVVYRNYDHSFKPSAQRKIDVSIIFDDGVVTATDTTGVTASVKYFATDKAINVEKASESISNSFSKSGDTVFNVTDVEVLATPFLPSSRLNEIRRSLFDELIKCRLENYVRNERKEKINHPGINAESVGYLYNVSNRLSRQFYEKCDVKDIAPAYEIEKRQGAVLLRTRHCIRREMGMCLNDKGVDRRPLFIENNKRRFALTFDCAVCEMCVVDA